VRWLVGDIQGCVRELDRLLREIGFDPARDELWSLGDLVNRGPESLETLRLWRDVEGYGVLGNHDSYTLLVHSGHKKRKPDTLAALFDAPDCDDLLDRVRRLPLLVQLASGGVGPDVWVVHAGLHPAWQDDLPAAAESINAGPHDDAWLKTEDTAFATRVRCCTAEGERSRYKGVPDRCPEPYRPWDDFYRGDTLVVHGHWAQRGHYRTERTMGLDSGCVYGGALTAWCQDEDRIVRIPSLA